MQLSLSFSALLASFVIAMSASGVQALPLKRNAGMVTLPLKRIESRSGIHPQLVNDLQPMSIKSRSVVHRLVYSSISNILIEDIGVLHA